MVNFEIRRLYGGLKKKTFYDFNVTHNTGDNITYTERLTELFVEIKSEYGRRINKKKTDNVRFYVCVYAYVCVYVYVWMCVCM